MIYDHDPPPEVRNLPRLVPPEPGPAFLVRLPDTEATRTTVFEADAVGPRGGSLVEVDGDAVAPPDFETGVAGEDGALGERDAADRDERDDVGRANAGMDAALAGQVN